MYSIALVRMVDLLCLGDAKSLSFSAKLEASPRRLGIHLRKSAILALRLVR